MKKSKHKRLKEKPIIHDQWIEIRNVNGVVVTTFYPPNEEFEQARLEMDSAPSLIYRRFNFVHGVPPEYMWTLPPPHVRELGGLFLQRVDANDWPQVLKADRATNHLVATKGPSFVPRPECYGPCPCEVCMAEEQNPPEAA